jgi:hypothetical protein
MVADTMAVVAGAMVMEATTAIPDLVFTSVRRFILILTTAILISTPIIIRQPWSPYRQHRRSTSSNPRRLPNNIQPVTGITATTPKAIILILRNAQTVGNKLSRYRPHLVKESKYVTFFHNVFGHGYTSSNRLRELAQRTQCHGAARYRSVFRTIS